MTTARAAHSRAGVTDCDRLVEHPMTALPTTASGWVTHTVNDAQRAIDKTWETGTLPPPLEHMLLIGRTVNGCVEALLWEALRLTAPEVADKLANEVAELCEAGDSFGELLWEWLQRIAAHQPISQPSLAYADIFQRIGLTSGDAVAGGTA